MQFVHTKGLQDKERDLSTFSTFIIKPPIGVLSFLLSYFLSLLLFKLRKDIDVVWNKEKRVEKWITLERAVGEETELTSRMRGWSANR